MTHIILDQQYDVDQGAVHNYHSTRKRGTIIDTVSLKNAKYQLFKGRYIYLSVVWLGHVDFSTDTKKHVFIKKLIACSKFDNNIRAYAQ